MRHYLGIPELQAAYGWSTAYVYKLAHLHGWRRITIGRTVRYHWQDVASTIEQRERHGGAQ